jgi:4-carboxymuconolactone decarboxylase
MKRIPLPPGTWRYSCVDRLTPRPASQRNIRQKLLLALTRRQAGVVRDLHVFLMLARLGSIFPRYLLFLSHLLMKGRIARADKERIILHVAWRLGCVYEWGHHFQIAQALGLNETDILSVAQQYSDRWDQRLTCLIAGADEIIDDKCLSEATWNRLARHLSEEQLVEFCMLVGHYMMVAVTIHSTGVRLEPEYAIEKHEE